MSYKKEAINVLTRKNLHPEYIVNELNNKPNKMIILQDIDNYTWTFVVRRRCHLYLLAKNQYMDKYEEIYSKNTF